MPPVSVQGIDQFDLLLVYGGEAGIQVHDAPEYGDGHAGHDDGSGGCAQPYDQQRRQCGFWQTVEHDEIGLQDFRQPAAAPEQDGRKHAEHGDQQEACDCLVECNADVQEDGAIQHHIPEAQRNAGRTAEDKGVDDSRIRGGLPQEEKENQDQDARGPDCETVKFHSVQKEFLAFRWSVHFCSAPSRFH